jgi:hypothetical protein
VKVQLLGQFSAHLTPNVECLGEKFLLLLFIFHNLQIPSAPNKVLKNPAAFLTQLRSLIIASLNFSVSALQFLSYIVNNQIDYLSILGNNRR